MAAGDLPTVPDKDFVHAVSGFKFAPKVGDFDRTGARQYDDDGLDISVSYREKEKHIILTAYVYACKLRTYGGDLEKEFSECEAGINAKHMGVKAINVGPVKLVQDGRTFEGKKGIYSVEHFGGSDGKAAISQLYLFVYQKNFIEFRITHPPGNDQADEEAIAAFLKTLKWP